MATPRPCPACGSQAPTQVTWTIEGSFLKSYTSSDGTSTIQAVEIDLRCDCQDCSGSNSVLEIRLLWAPCPKCGQSDADDITWSGYRKIQVAGAQSPGTLVSRLHIAIQMRWACDICGMSGDVDMNTNGSHDAEAWPTP